MTIIIAAVSKRVIAIWSIKGSTGKIPSTHVPSAPVPASHPLGPTLRKRAIGMDNSAPQIAPLLVVFLQKSPNRNMARIPGLTRPVYS